MKDLAVTKASLPECGGLDSLLTDFVSYLDCRPQTVRTYLTGIRQLLAWLKETGHDPDRDAIIAWRDHLKATTRPATVQTYMAGARRFFAWLEVRMGRPSPCQGVKSVRIPPGFRKDCLTADQARELLESVDTSTLKGRRDKAILALMLTCGLRDCEIARARICDLEAIDGHTALAVHGKGRDGADAYVHIVPTVEALLREYLTHRGETDPLAPLFVNRTRPGTKDPLTTRSISRIVKTRLTAMGLDSPRLTAHSLRHTAATLNLLGGGTLDETQALLRHSSITTTQLYAHHLTWLKRQAEARIADQLFPPKRQKRSPVKPPPRG